MTDEQIVRALEQCASEEYCSGCSVLGRASVGYECTRKVMKKVMKDAAALIKREEAEIEDLREIIFTDRTEAIKKLKAEAVREFAERLKCESYQAANGGYISSDRVVSVADIDNLVREMTEGT